MARTITITVPDGLFERLQKVKSEFNISGICQQALEREVSIREMMRAKPKGLGRKIKRLKAEKREHDLQYGAAGHKQGYTDAPDLTYQEIMGFVAAQLSDNWPVDIAYKSTVWKRLESQLRDLERDDPGFSRPAFLRGWIEGVFAFWDKHKESLE